MEHDHDTHEENAPSGAMIRDHWNNWTWFTGMTKKGIIAVAVIVVIAMFFITR